MNVGFTTNSTFCYNIYISYQPANLPNLKICTWNFYDQWHQLQTQPSLREIVQVRASAYLKQDN